MPAVARALPLVASLVLLSMPARAEVEFAAQVTSFTLDNGLEVVVIPDHRAPIVTHMVWYKVGSADESEGTSGIAHFLEHLMFKGTEAHPEGEFSEVIHRIGGNENAFTSDDATGYHQSVAKEHLGLLMEYEADRMANLVLDDEAVIPERGVILEERRSRIDNNPAAQLGEAVAAALFRNSRYGVPIIGWQHEMETLDREDALAFYDRFYTPNNAIVVVAGDVTEDEVRALAEATYGKVARRAEPPERIRGREPEPGGPQTVTLADPRVTQPSLRRSFVVPSYTTGEAGAAAALDILGEILGGGTTSRLYRQLVVDDAVATSAGAYYRGGSLGDTSFTVYAVPRGDIGLEALAAEIQAVVEDLVESGVTEDELTRAKRRLIADAVYAQDRLGGFARVFGSALTTGRSIEDVRAWPAAIEAVTADQVVAAARAYLDADRSVTGLLVGAPEENCS